MGYHLQHCRKGPDSFGLPRGNGFLQRRCKELQRQDRQRQGSGQQPFGWQRGASSSSAASFAQETDLLIVEDPTRGIDVGAIEFIWQKIIDISNQGISVLLISHELGEVMELSDRILVIYNGGIVADLKNTPELTEETVGLYMLGGTQDETA